MLFGIFGDIHSNFDALSAVVKDMKKMGVDQYCCIGDIVGYAAEPAKCIKMLKNLGCQISAGNHDYGVADKINVDDFNADAYDAIMWTKDALSDADKQFLADLPLVVNNDLFTLVHGTLHNPITFRYMINLDEAESTFKILDNKICFIGHTHIPVTFFQKNGDATYSFDNEIDLDEWEKVIINTGSIGQPRDRDPRASYVLLDTEENRIIFRRVEYDVGNAQKKIYQSGLPRRNGDRLLFIG